MVRVDTYQVTYLCDECAIGNMEFNGMCNPTNPMLYGHTCTHCGQNHSFSGISYPRTITKVIE
jgi:hypothetical protein